MNTENRPPVTLEETLTDLPVEGGIPPELNGTLYRNGPNPIEPDTARHWFFGNGMIHAFRLRNRRVSYRNRWVRTRHWASAVGESPDGLPDGVANTNVIAPSGRLLALEEAHMPVRVDAVSLATLGTEDFGGTLPIGPFTAHPKTCPVTGNLVFFGYAADGWFSDTIRLGEVTADGSLASLAKLRAPYGAMIHDFAVTGRFIAIPLFPLVLDADQGGYVWKPDLGAYLGVIDRAKGADSVTWIPLDGGFAFHIANAWDDAGTLVVDLMRSDAPPLFPGPQTTAPDSTRSFLTRWRVDLTAANPKVTARRVSGVEGEFPRIDERWTGRPNRLVYWSTGAAISRHDDQTGTDTMFEVHGGDTVCEPVFAPRGSAEGDGWLLTVIYRHATKTSDLAILDAQDIAAGPVALVRLPVRVPDGFHGAWIGGGA